ncbi:MAG: RnfABCDGE type electron transport complex subunit D [Victivallaceae bacterium]|nr:RnfABCDGE type electron transport complex subunit D [Victivallaceae bacterium]
MSENCNNVKLPSGDELILSSSPHIHDNQSVRKIMLKVIVALLPAAAAGVFFFGLPAAGVILLTLASCVAAEAIWFFLAKRPLSPLGDCSAALTGLILALNLPPATPWWVCVLGGFLAIWVGKQVFGGLGHNPFNPALVARVALLIALPAALTTWTPTGIEAADSEFELSTYATPLGKAAMLKTTATPHGSAHGDIYAELATDDAYWNYFIGNRGGSLGETSCLALLIGGIALMLMKLIKWQIPLVFIATVGVFSGAVHFFAPAMTPPALFHLMTGGLLLGAFFMATDMVTSPMTTWGCVIFAFGCGVITCVIRIWGSYPEGVSFSILFMNALVPLIDRMCQLRPFGYVRKKA